MSIDADAILNDYRFVMYCVSLNVPRHLGLGILIYVKHAIGKMSQAIDLTGSLQKRVTESVLEWHMYEHLQFFPSFEDVWDKLVELHLLVEDDFSADEADPRYLLNF